MRLALGLLAALVLALPASAGRLPILASHDWSPVWSPDAQWIAFTRVNGQGRVFSLEVVPAGGGRVVQVAQGSLQPLPSWSPDSERLAYQSGGHVWTVARDGSGRRSVTAGLFPAWSPDGATIAYVRGGELRVGARVLAAGVIARPAWSPDGSELAFARSDGIYSVDANTGDVRQVAGTSAEPTAPVWSLDGTRVAYTAAGSVFVADRRGPIPARQVAGPYKTVSSPSWAPVGDTIVFTADSRVRSTLLSAPPRTSVGSRAEVGAAFSPGDLNGYRVAASLALARCPGHSGIDAGVVLSGTCVIHGTAAADLIEGTPSGGDVVLAGAGNDRIHVADRHTDRIDCGAGFDTVWADHGDRLAHCEVVRR